MSATARAEARRKAILARGGDRLAKLTSSARGDDAAAFAHDDPPLAPLPSRPLDTFVGDEPALPAPRTVRSKSGPRPTNASEPPAWSEEQQAQIMNAFMGGAFPTGPLGSAGSDGSVPPIDGNPLAALMSTMNAGGPNPFAPPAQTQAPTKPKSLLQKLMPLIHILAAWTLLAYFVLWKEPETYDARTHWLSSSDPIWKRWAELSWTNAGEGWGVQALPFFWAFTTLTLVLHSWHILSGLDAIQPPMLLSLAMPVLPPMVRVLITTGFKYLQMVGMFLDDLAGILVGIGLLIYIASCIAG